MRSSAAVSRRAALAFAMFFVLYAGILGVAGFFAYCATIPYSAAVDLGISEGVSLGIQIAFASAAAWIVWTVRPRRPRFTAPGPLLDKLRQPRIFDEVESVARSMNQPMPDEIYLVPGVNAAIGVRGGFLGLSGKRSVFLGLPLLRGLTRAQLRAVLAHEFGHACAGDLRLGPWTHSMRSTMLAVLQALGGKKPGGIAQTVLGAYARLFLRVSQSVSRHQEFVADELAAHNEGPKNLIEGLRATYSISPAFTAFWHGECVPVLDAGFLPPLASGFDLFLRSDQIVREMQKSLAFELGSEKSNPYDSHPPLAERIAAVEQVHTGMESVGSDPAMNLIDDLPDLEREIVTWIGGKEAAEKLAPIGWSEVGRRVWLPHWRTLAQKNARLLADVEPASLPALVKDFGRFQAQVVSPVGLVTDPESRKRLAQAVLGSGLCVLLASRGAAIDARPGKEVTVRVGSRFIEPFGVVPRLMKGELSAEEWTAQCEQLGIAGARLAPPLTAAA